MIFWRKWAMYERASLLVLPGAERISTPVEGTDGRPEFPANSINGGDQRDANCNSKVDFTRYAFRSNLVTS